MINYTGYLTVLVIVEYFALLAAVVVIQCLVTFDALCDRSNLISSAVQILSFGQQFEDVYNSSVAYLGVLCLLMTRLLSFLYLLVVVGLSLYLNEHSQAHLQVWNVCAVMVYFLLAAVCSVIGVRFGGSYSNGTIMTTMTDDGSRCNRWSMSTVLLGHCVQGLFEVIGPTSSLLTVIAFCIDFNINNFLNLSSHLLTTLLLLVELALNKIDLRWSHVVYSVAWTLIVWPSFTLTAADGSPHFTLSTDSAACLWQYQVLVWGTVSSYGMWSILSLLKSVAVRVISTSKF